MNMPATFAPAYTTDSTNYANKMQQFLDSEEQGIIDTNAKITANNQVYTTLINMFKDGQEIFKSQDQIKRQFVFDTVLGLISNPGAAGLRGTISSSIDASPISGATILVLDTSETTTTDESGNYLLKPLAAGNYNISFGAANYRDKVIHNIHITTGVTSTLDTELEPV